MTTFSSKIQAGRPRKDRPAVYFRYSRCFRLMFPGRHCHRSFPAVCRAFPEARSRCSRPGTRFRQGVSCRPASPLHPAGSFHRASPNRPEGSFHQASPNRPEGSFHQASSRHPEARVLSDVSPFHPPFPPPPKPPGPKPPPMPPKPEPVIVSVSSTVVVRSPPVTV